MPTYTGQGWQMANQNFQQAGSYSNPVQMQEVTITAKRPDKLKKQNIIRNIQKGLYNAGLYGEISEKKAVDSIIGPMTRAALQKAKDAGYDINTETGEINYTKPIQKSKIESKKPSIFETLYTPGTTPQYVQDAANEAGQQVAFANPAVALANRWIHGKLGLSSTYSAIPEDQKKVLSDQNQYIFDNWNTVFSGNIGVAQKTLNENLKALDKAKKEGNIKEIETLKKEIESNKKSVSDISNLYQKIKKAGGLESYLKSNPGKKVVVGANFGLYKRNNMHRFPQGTPSRYANFDAPNYVNYAMNTPLGKVENIFGNTVQSFMYDPKQNIILTRASDTYDFNPRSASKEGATVSKLREKVGNDDVYSKRGSVNYSVDLYPIKPGQSNYTTDFGKPQKEDSAFMKFLIKMGIKAHE